jgi:hypothetical protein
MDLDAVGINENTKGVLVSGPSRIEWLSTTTSVLSC